LLLLREERQAACQEFWGAPGREQAASNVLSQRSCFATSGRNVKRKLDSEREKITGFLGK
jgi:hypothetical protein